MWCMVKQKMMNNLKFKGETAKEEEEEEEYKKDFQLFERAHIRTYSHFLGFVLSL